MYRIASVNTLDLRSTPRKGFQLFPKHFTSNCCPMPGVIQHNTRRNRVASNSKTSNIKRTNPHRIGHIGGLTTTICDRNTFHSHQPCSPTSIDHALLQWEAHHRSCRFDAKSFACFCWGSTLQVRWVFPCACAFCCFHGCCWLHRVTFQRLAFVKRGCNAVVVCRMLCSCLHSKKDKSRCWLSLSLLS